MVLFALFDDVLDDAGPDVLEPAVATLVSVLVLILPLVVPVALDAVAVLVPMVKGGVTTLVEASSPLPLPSASGLVLLSANRLMLERLRRDCSHDLQCVFGKILDYYAARVECGWAATMDPIIRIVDRGWPIMVYVITVVDKCH